MFKAWAERQLYSTLASFCGSPDAYGKHTVRIVTDELVRRFGIYRGEQGVAMTDHALRYWVNGAFGNEKLAVVDRVLTSGDQPRRLTSSEVDEAFKPLARYLLSTGEAGASDVRI